MTELTGTLGVARMTGMGRQDEGGAGGAEPLPSTRVGTTAAALDAGKPGGAGSVADAETGADPGAEGTTLGETFGEVLRQLRTERGVSQAGVAARAGMDRSYVNRIEAGERGVPAVPAVEALIGALQLSPAEGDRLLAAAGILPRALRALGPNDPTVLLLAERLTDGALSPAARIALRATIEAIIRHWSNAQGTHGSSAGHE